MTTKAATTTKKAPAYTRAPKTAAAAHRYATLEQAAEYLVCSTRHIRDEIARGAITGYRLGSHVRVDLNELDATLTVIPTGGRQAANRGDKAVA